MATDPKRIKDLERSLQGLERRDPKIKELFRIACEGHDYMRLDEGGRFNYTIIGADSSLFENPGKGITCFAVDDDYTKTDIKSIEALSKLPIDERGIGLMRDITRTSTLRKTDYHFLPISFYGLIGSGEEIMKTEGLKPGEKQPYVLFLKRSKTGMPKDKIEEEGKDIRKTVENNFCIGMEFNGSAERASFHLNDFNISTYMTDSHKRFPLMLKSEEFGIIPVVDIKTCLALYRDAFIRDNPGLAESYPKFSGDCPPGRDFKFR